MKVFFEAMAQFQTLSAHAAFQFFEWTVVRGWRPSYDGEILKGWYSNRWMDFNKKMLTTQELVELWFRYS